MTERKIFFDAMILTTYNTFIKATVFGRFEDDTSDLRQLKIDGIVADADKHPYIKKGDMIDVHEVLLKVNTIKK